MKKNLQRQIKESDAVILLIQIYLSHSSKWYSALIASTLSMLGVPILSLNLSIMNTDASSYGTAERCLFSFLTLFILMVTVYLSSKVIYSLAILESFYRSIKIVDIKNNLAEYLILRKTDLKSKIKSFKFYRFQKNVDKEITFYSSLIFIIFFFVGLFLLILIWWSHENIYYYIVLFGFIHLFLLSCLFKFVPIL